VPRVKKVIRELKKGPPPTGADKTAGGEKEVSERRKRGKGDEVAGTQHGAFLAVTSRARRRPQGKRRKGRGDGSEEGIRSHEQEEVGRSRVVKRRVLWNKKVSKKKKREEPRPGDRTHQTKRRRETP